MSTFAAVSEILLRTAAKLTGRTGHGQIPEWPNGADCKSAGLRLRWFESIFAHEFAQASLIRNAEIAQLVEH